MAVESAAGTTGSDRPPEIEIRVLGGTGADILLIHGFGSDRMSWLANAPALQAAARVSALDLPGHGASGPEVGDGRMATLAAAVEAAVERQGGGPRILLGHSLGGGIALLLAGRRPDLVSGLVLIAPAGLGRGVDPAFLSAFPQLADASVTEALLQRLVSRPRLINKQLVALVQKQLAAPGAREALVKVAAGIASAGPGLASAIAMVRRLDVPRLTVWGEADGINPLDPDALAAFGGTTLVIPEVGHLPYVEAASAVNAAVLDFMGRHVAG